MPNQMERRLAESQPTVAESATAIADGVNAKLGLSGWRGQVAQFGGIAIIFGAFLMLLVWFRNDWKAIVSDLLRQQSVERAEDREARSTDRAEDRAARKEAATIQAAAMGKTRIGDWRVPLGDPHAGRQDHDVDGQTRGEDRADEVIHSPCWADSMTSVK